MRRRVLVVGGSDQGRQVIDVLQAGGEHIVVGIVDRALQIGTEVVGHRVVGPDTDLAACADREQADAFVVAVGDNHVRAAALTRAREACPGLTPVSAIHPSAVVAADATIGAGSIVMAGAVVSNGCTVGTGALLGTNASVDHDGMLHDFVSLAPGAVTGGNVRIGAGTAIGVGVSIAHDVSIGADTVIGAGAAVVADVPDLVVAYGVPARVARARTVDEPYL